MRELGILGEIAARTKERIQEEKRWTSLADVKSMVADVECDAGYPFEKAMRKEGLSFICEVKKASPSKGVIAVDFPYEEIAEAYEAAGADAISVLTEPFYFLGKDQYLQDIRRRVSLPLLRKDFVVDEYMIYQAKLLGADAILLICSILSEAQLREYLQIASSIGLSVLTEVHDAREMEIAISSKASIIGVNNRSLRDFSINLDNARKLRDMVPDGVVFVTESGIRTAEDIQKVREMGSDSVLIGEAFMKSRDKSGMMAVFRGVTQTGKSQLSFRLGESLKSLSS
jgi:indole-3-glycerol phosphate synthase